MNKIKKIYNFVFCRRWLWIIMAFTNCLSALIAMERGEMEVAGRFILGAIFYVAMSFVSKRFTL